MIEFRALGSFEVVEGGRALAMGSPRQRALLAVLLLHRGERVSSERLVDDLWGERAPASATKIVHGYVSNLRKVLGDGLLMTRGHGYVLQTGPGQTDLDQFKSLVADGRRALQNGDTRTAVARLRGALGLWRGPPLADFAYDSFAQPEIARLEESRLTALEERVDAELELGEHAHLVAELKALVHAYPLRERFLCALMLALYRSGRQADALERYQCARVQLGDELGLEPGPALTELQMQILEHASGLRSSPPPGHDTERRLVPGSAAADGRSTLPPPSTPLIGRENELATVCGLLEGLDVRLVTLTGTGGVGKTRLALEAMRALESSFPDGVGWVELAAVVRPDDVGSTVARALGVSLLPGESPRQALCRYLTGKRLLLAIDNFEHLLEAAQLVADLLDTCPGLALLVTSRESLNLAAEHRVIIAPLSVPDIRTATVAEIESTAGSALFLAASRRRDNGFAFSPTAAPAIAQICTRLDGLPLALELAAARTGILTVEELAAQLSEVVTDLGVGPRDAPDRQRTLQSAIEWSYNRLDEPLQRAFVHFAIFAGGATLDAAKAVIGADLATVEALIGKGLIDRRRQPDDGATRLVMLETIRQFALRRLATDTEHHGVHPRHCQYYLELIEQAVPRLSTLDEPQALAVLDAEIDNARSALQWALEAAPDISLRLAGQLGMYWRLRVDLEGLRWLDASLQAAGERAPLTDRARARLHHADQLAFRNDHAAAIEGLRAALALYRQADDHAGMSETLCRLAESVGLYTDDVAAERRYALRACRHARIAGDDELLGQALGKLAAVAGDQRRAILEQAAELLIPLGNYRQVADAYNSAAYGALTEDRVAEATSLLETALRAATRIDDPLQMTVIHSDIGLARLFSGDPNRARDAFEQALRLCAQYAFRGVADESLAGLAAVAAAQGRDETAARLRGAAHALGYPPTTFDKRIDDRLERDYLAVARTRQGDAAWHADEQAGAGLSREQAIAYVLDDRSGSAGRQTDERGTTTHADRQVNDPGERPTAMRATPGIERQLATVMFTDIVGSTSRAADLGDQRWRVLLDTHDAIVRAELARVRGVEIKFTGDGLLATFDGPARAIDSAYAMREAVRTLGIEIRIGIHTGEIELREDDIGGIAVHIGARVAALARPSEILVSQTVIDLVTGSGIRFDERGPHKLKGVPGTWRLYTVLQHSDRHIRPNPVPSSPT